MFKKLFHTLSALNQVWYADEKRLTDRIMRFEAVPENAGKRIEAAILHTNDGQRCLEEIKALCADTAQIAQQRYPDLDLQLDWV